MKHALWIVSLTAAAALALPGCRSYGTYVLVHQHEPTPVAFVDEGGPADPPKVAETETPRPSDRHVRVPSHWVRSCGEYRWVTAHWVVPPERGARFVRGHYNARYGHWVVPHWR